jgi:hypothetical protein
VIIAAMVLGAAGVASAADLWWDSDDWFGLSGFSGAWRTLNIGDNVTLDDSANEFAISGIGVQETQDKPCHVWIFGREMGISSSANDVIGEEELPGCNSFGSLVTFHSVSFGTDRYVRAIRACNNNNNNHRLKGLKIKAALVNSATGTVTEEETYDIYQQTNCDVWGSWVTCPDNEVAVAIRLNHENDAVVGLELKCAPVHVR